MFNRIFNFIFNSILNLILNLVVYVIFYSVLYLLRCWIFNLNILFDVLLNAYSTLYSIFYVIFYITFYLRWYLIFHQKETGLKPKDALPCLLEVWQPTPSPGKQCFCFGWNDGYVTLQIIANHPQKYYFLMIKIDSSTNTYSKSILSRVETYTSQTARGRRPKSVRLTRHPGYKCPAYRCWYTFHACVIVSTCPSSVSLCAGFLHWALSTDCPVHSPMHGEWCCVLSLIRLSLCEPVTQAVSIKSL